MEKHFFHGNYLVQETLIILASGNSSRFKNAGFKSSKYLLPFAGRTILDNLVSSASGRRVILVVNENDFNDLDIDLSYRYKYSDPNFLVLPIPLHHKGPVHSLNSIREFIPLDSTVHVSYCDYHASALLSGDCFRIAEDSIASVLVYSGFHPHHLPQENIYGYLKTDESGLPIDYLEKAHFTSNKLNEPCSAVYIASEPVLFCCQPILLHQIPLSSL